MLCSWWVIQKRCLAITERSLDCPRKFDCFSPLAVLNIVDVAICTIRFSWSDYDRRRITAIGSLLLVFFAVLPNVLHLDHLPVSGPVGHSHEIEDLADLQEHSAHCHIGLASCADQPVSSGSSLWWLVGSEPLDLSGNLQAVVTAHSNFLPEGSISVQTPPPRLT